MPLWWPGPGGRGAELGQGCPPHCPGHLRPGELGPQARQEERPGDSLHKGICTLQLINPCTGGAAQESRLTQPRNHLFLFLIEILGENVAWPKLVEMELPGPERVSLVT